MSVYLDQETNLPLCLLYKHPQNPKTAIHGVYKQGLKLSIEEQGNANFELDDRLKVWANPDTPGKYCVINGNQRFDVLIERHRDELVKKYFQLQPNCKPSEVTRIINDSSNADKLREIHNEVMKIEVPVQIKTLKAEGEKFKESDAKAYVMTYDRNHARFDEGKQALLYRDLVTQVGGDASERVKFFLDNVARPEKAFVAPVQRQLNGNVVPSTNDLSSNSPSGLPNGLKELEDYEQEWGPIPNEHKLNDSSPSGQPNEGNVSSLQDKVNNFNNNQQQLIPMVFSLTAEGFKEIDERILKLKARLFREKRLRQALEDLEKFVGDDLQNLPVSDIIVEVALLTLGRHVEIQQAKVEANGQQNIKASKQDIGGKKNGRSKSKAKIPN